MPVDTTIPANGAVHLTAGELEDGGLGDGRGKWRLTVTADRDLIVMNLMETPTGHLTNLSTAPAVEETLVPLFPGLSPTRQGFVRIINETDEDQQVTVTVYDRLGDPYGPLSLTLAAHTVLHFNSDDLYHGNDGKGITGIRCCYDDMYLTVEGTVRVLTYMRTKTDGFLTSLHDTVPENGQVATFNPASNPNQRSMLRVLNPEEPRWRFEAHGRDDAGHMDQQGYNVAGNASSYNVYPAHMEKILGDGTGKWRLRLLRDTPFVSLVFMNLMETPSGHLTNLSTIPGTVMPFPTGTFAGQAALIHRINEAGEHNGKVVIWEGSSGDPYEGSHAEAMHAIMVN